MKYKRGHCQHPFCKGEKLLKARGLCAYHWRELNYRVDRGETSWPELEQGGYCLPPYKR